MKVLTTSTAFHEKKLDELIAATISAEFGAIETE
jgi:hypothetical protein